MKKMTTELGHPIFFNPSQVVCVYRERANGPTIVMTNSGGWCMHVKESVEEAAKILWEI